MKSLALVLVLAALSACTPQPAQVIPLDPPPLTCTVWDDGSIREIPCPALVDRDGTNTEQDAP